MKGEVVSAFRERGLHLGVRDAEPQVSESINSIERKTDTMKSYILRELKAVQPQKSARPSRSKPAGRPAAMPDLVVPGTEALSSGRS